MRKSAVLRQATLVRALSHARVASSAVRLSSRTLRALPPSLSTPNYCRSTLEPGIVHFGVGNFHRSHQALYLHRLFDRGLSQNYAIVGAGTRPAEIPRYEALKRQDFLYTLVEQSTSTRNASVIGSILDYVPPANFRLILDALEDQRTKIVSLTVTEGGYYQSQHPLHLDLTHPDIVAEAANASAIPSTVFGLISRALASRRKAKVPPFTVLSCDNVPHNGTVARAAVCGVTALHDGELANWIDGNVAFPESMVDRITPATSDEHRDTVTYEFGVADAAPVFCEGYIEWVLEDKFSAGRPALEEVGVKFVDDVSVFETMKIRILNGGHAAIAYPAALLDLEYAHDAMTHPLISAFLQKLQRNEILPVVPKVPRVDLNEYLETVCVRFANANMKDTVERLCSDGSNRQPKFIVSSIRDRIEAGQTVDGLALVSALWSRYCYGISESNRKYHPNDPQWDSLVAAAREARHNHGAWTQQRHIYGNLADNVIFNESFQRWLDHVWRRGTTSALNEYLDS